MMLTRRSLVHGHSRPVATRTSASPGNLHGKDSGLEKSAAIRPFATKKSHLASEKILLADSLATESSRLADRLATKLFFKADNADADRM